MKKEDNSKNPVEKFQSMFRRNSGQKQDGSPKKINFTLWYFILAFILMISLQQYFFSKNVETLPYSKFKQELSAGHISKLTIGSDTINGTLSAEGKTPRNLLRCGSKIRTS